MRRVPAHCPGVCYCCKTSVATGADGSIVASWRHVYREYSRHRADEIDGWWTDVYGSGAGQRRQLGTRRVSREWTRGRHRPGECDSCGLANPGPGSSRHRTGLALFYARSSDGKGFTKRQQIPTEGVPRHAQIAIGPAGGIIVAWDEQVNGARRIVSCRCDRGRQQRREVHTQTDRRRFGQLPGGCGCARCGGGGVDRWSGGRHGHPRRTVSDAEVIHGSRVSIKRGARGSWVNASIATPDRTCGVRCDRVWLRR